MLVSHTDHVDIIFPYICIISILFPCYIEAKEQGKFNIGSGKQALVAWWRQAI